MTTIESPFVDTAEERMVNCELNEKGDRIVVVFDYAMADVQSIKKVPGATFFPPNKGTNKTDTHTGNCLLAPLDQLPPKNKPVSELLTQQAR